MGYQGCVLRFAKWMDFSKFLPHYIIQSSQWVHLLQTNFLFIYFDHLSLPILISFVLSGLDWIRGKCSVADTEIIGMPFLWLGVTCTWAKERSASELSGMSANFTFTHSSLTSFKARPHRNRTRVVEMRWVEWMDVDHYRHASIHPPLMLQPSIQVWVQGQNRNLIFI